MRIAVLISGAGSNLQSLIEHSVLKSHPYTIELVIADSHDKAALGLLKARKVNIPTEIVDYKSYDGKKDAEIQITTLIEKYQIDLIVLAGYMRIMSPCFVNRWRRKIINLHPSLLPSFPGLHAIRQAYQYGVTITGVTVHYVDEGMDTGRIIEQRSCEINKGWSLDELENKIHSIEHKLLPEVVRNLAITLKNI